MRSSLLLGCLAAFAMTGVSATGSTAKVDVHSHFVPDFYAASLREAGYTPGPDGMPAIPVSDTTATASTIADVLHLGLDSGRSPPIHGGK